MRRRVNATDRLRAVMLSASAAELTRSLDDPSPEVVLAAVRRLSEIGGLPAAGALRARLLACDVSLAGDIAKALRRIGDDSVVDIAIAGLREAPYTRRLAAARALGALREVRAVSALQAALSDEIAGVRIAALGALGELGLGTGSAADCAQLLADPDPHVRVAAVRAVARTAARPGDMLLPVAGDADRGVRLEVARHVATLPEQAAHALLIDRDLRVREAAAESAGGGQAEVLAVLLVEDPSGDVRRVAAQTLGRLGCAQLADGLLPGLEDPDAVVRAAVLRALERLLTHDGVVRRVRDELSAVRSQRRRASLYALAHLKALHVASDVALLASDPDPDVRLAVIHTARSLLADPEPIVHDLAADRDPTVRESAQNWLVRARRVEG